MLKFTHTQLKKEIIITILFKVLVNKKTGRDIKNKPHEVNYPTPKDVDSLGNELKRPRAQAEAQT